MSKATYKRKNVYRGLEFIMVEQRHSNTGIDRDKHLRAHILSHKQKVEYTGNDESLLKPQSQRHFSNKTTLNLS